MVMMMMTIDYSQGRMSLKNEKHPFSFSWTFPWDQYQHCTRTSARLACATSCQATLPLYGRLQNIQPPAQVVRVRDKFSTSLCKANSFNSHCAWFLYIALPMPHNALNWSKLLQVWATHWGVPGASEALQPAGVSQFNVKESSVWNHLITCQSSANLFILSLLGILWALASYNRSYFCAQLAVIFLVFYTSQSLCCAQHCLFLKCIVSISLSSGQYTVISQKWQLLFHSTRPHLYYACFNGVAELVECSKGKFRVGSEKVLANKLSLMF